MSIETKILACAALSIFLALTLFYAVQAYVFVLTSRSNYHSAAQLITYVYKLGKDRVFLPIEVAMVFVHAKEYKKIDELFGNRAQLHNNSHPDEYLMNIAQIYGYVAQARLEDAKALFKDTASATHAMSHQDHAVLERVIETSDLKAFEEFCFTLGARKSLLYPDKESVVNMWSRVVVFPLMMILLGVMFIYTTFK